MSRNLRNTLTLVTRAKSGDNEALNLLLGHYLDRILRMVRMRIGSKMRARLDSMDVVQEVMSRAIKGFENFEVKHEAAFLHWIRKLVQNEIINLANHHNAQKRNINNEVSKNQEFQENRSVISQIPADSIWHPSKQLRLKNEIIELESAMDQLKEDQKEIIIMKQYEGLTYREISGEIGISEDAARMKYGRAMDKLTDILTDLRNTKD